MSHRAVRLALGIGAGAAAAFAIACLAIAGFGLRDDARPSDVALVLGNRVDPDGRPSRRLAARLDRALALYRSRTVGKVIVSGGRGKEGFSEAQVMAEYLAAKGVPARDIILDEAGVDTCASVINTARIMRRGGFRSVVAVSQFFHLPRTRLALAKVDGLSATSAPADYFELRDIYSTAREVVGLAAYAIGAKCSEL